MAGTPRAREGEPKLELALGKTRRQRWDRIELRFLVLERCIGRMEAEMAGIRRALDVGPTYPVDVNERPTFSALLARYIEQLMVECRGDFREVARVGGVEPMVLVHYLTGQTLGMVVKNPNPPKR